MRRSTLVRFLLISVLASLALGSISFFALRALNEASTSEARRHLISFFTQAVEDGPSYAEALRSVRQRPGRRISGTNLWVFSGSGALLASSGDLPPPVAWDSLRKPTEVHDVAFQYHLLRLIPDSALVRLDTQNEAYLLIEFRRPGASSSLMSLWIGAAFILFLFAVGALIALVLIYAFLKRKSREARLVLSRLEKGDLKARFEISRFDELGSLMGDFNRMASEIERLVLRLKETEIARGHLLEELSHDLRTPLTSLRTSTETLAEHFGEMPPAEQKEFLSVIRQELSYFLHLVEDLFFIADLGEPRYKSEARTIDVVKVLREEVGLRGARAKHLSWRFEHEHGRGEAEGDSIPILGDPLLIRRLFTNAFDNAARHAATSVRVRVASLVDSIVVRIEDDGPGISDEAISAFGQRRKRRIQSEDVSLGLGSVIMKTILELHGGTFAIRRLDGARGGTELALFLRRDRPSALLA